MADESVWKRLEVLANWHERSTAGAYPDHLATMREAARVGREQARELRAIGGLTQELGVAAGARLGERISEAAIAQLARYHAVVEAAKRLLRSEDPEVGSIDTTGDATCEDCTAGTTPDSVNRGPCPLHGLVRALAAAEEPMSDVASWQRRFRQQPKVYAVQDPEGYVDALYATRDGAQMHLRFLRESGDAEMRRSGRRSSIRALHIHNDELAAERWSR